MSSLKLGAKVFLKVAGAAIIGHPQFHVLLKQSCTPQNTLPPSLSPDIMNGTMDHSWTQAKTAEGKVYYYNTQTKATQWTKPVELMTPVEVR